MSSARMAYLLTLLQKSHILNDFNNLKLTQKILIILKLQLKKNFLMKSLMKILTMRKKFYNWKGLLRK